jgi:hypothetical protein
MAAAGSKLQSRLDFIAPPIFGRQAQVSKPRIEPTAKNGQSGQSAVQASGSRKLPKSGELWTYSEPLLIRNHRRLKA